MWRGSVASLHIAPRAAAPMESVQSVRAVPGRGLEGDRYFLGTGLYSPKASHGGREVTLVEAEAVAALFDGVQNAEGHRLGIKLSAAETRRNIATSGVPLNHLVDREFWVGPVRMVGTRLCEPCKHLEDLTQKGVMAGPIHRGGLRARMLFEGVSRVGDLVVRREAERPVGARLESHRPSQHPPALEPSRREVLDGAARPAVPEWHAHDLVAGRDRAVP